MVPLTALEKNIVNEINKKRDISFGGIAVNLSISRHTVAEYVKS
jgi:DNA-binding CsgD family transcriptional regulator